MTLIIRFIKGGEVFQLKFDQSLPDAVTSAWATFGYKQVEVRKTHESPFILHGESIPGKYLYLSKPRLLARWEVSKKMNNFKKRVVTLQFMLWNGIDKPIQ